MELNSQVLFYNDRKKKNDHVIQGKSFYYSNKVFVCLFVF